MLPLSLKQFGLRQILTAIVWMSIAMALVTSTDRVLPSLGFCMLGGMLGVGLLFLSDLVDDRPMEDRGYSSSALNLLGIGILILSLLGMLMYFTLFLAMAIPQFNSQLRISA